MYDVLPKEFGGFAAVENIKFSFWFIAMYFSYTQMKERNWCWFHFHWKNLIFRSKSKNKTLFDCLKKSFIYKIKCIWTDGNFKFTEI